MRAAKTIRGVTASVLGDDDMRPTDLVELRGVSEWTKGAELVSAVLTPTQARNLAELLLTAARIAEKR